MLLEPQNLRTPSVSDAVTDGDSSGNGRLLPHVSTTTDLWMVTGATAGKTKVPSTQRRLTVTGGIQEAQEDDEGPVDEREL